MNRKPKNLDFRIDILDANPYTLEFSSAERNCSYPSLQGRGSGWAGVNAQRGLFFGEVACGDLGFPESGERNFLWLGEIARLWRLNLR
jgi:hypothetical protein